MDDARFVGLDVDKLRISVAVAETARGGTVDYLGEIDNDAGAVSKLCDRPIGRGMNLAFCYEAGPCGYGGQRQLARLGHRCDVVAPSLIPRKSGDRVKTNRRDATMLARLFRAGELSPFGSRMQIMKRCAIWFGCAALRCTKARQHLQGFLLRRGRKHKAVRLGAS